MPVAIIENGTRPNQRVTYTDLEHLTEILTQQNIKPPALLIIGELFYY